MRIQKSDTDTSFCPYPCRFLYCSLRLLLAYSKYYLTNVLALVKDIVSRFSLLNRENCMDGGLNKTCLDLGIYVTNKACKYLCLYCRCTRAKCASYDTNVTNVDILEIDLGLLTCESGDHYPSCAVCEVVTLSIVAIGYFLLRTFLLSFFVHFFIHHCSDILSLKQSPISNISLSHGAKTFLSITLKLV